MNDNLKKVLITARVHPYLVDTLTEKGYQVLYQPAISYDELYHIIHGCIGLVVTTRLNIDSHILDNANQLQWVARLGSGMEMIDVDYAARHGIRCVSSPEGNCDAVGEQAIGMLLCVYDNILKSNLELREGVWERERNRGFEIRDKTIGIIGYGFTGTAFARKLSGFDCQILAYDKYRKGYGHEGVKEAPMEEIFRKADVVSLHVPLTVETTHMVNTAFLQSFTGSVFLINTSRGQVIHTPDLVEGLKSGKVAGACLDVLENERPETMDKEEKIQFEYLLHAENVLITPHIAGYTHEASFKMALVVLRKLGILEQEGTPHIRGYNLSR
ncbi:MAG TPA: NAD(P)-dependent oxidoreductase [Chitinophagaceae bacterium]|nr:NAD(P)-dependent oxidoreductase [Chitinophagaceae bacterium]